MELQQVTAGGRIAIAQHYLGAYRKAQELRLSPRIIALAYRQLEQRCGVAVPLRPVSSWKSRVARGDAEPLWQGRLALLGDLLDEVAASGESIDQELQVWLASTLQDVGRWLPLTSEEAPREYGLMLLRVSGLFERLPSLAAFYQPHFTRFYEPFVESSLWSEFLGETPAASPLLRYLRGIALLHFFLITQRSSNEALLWQAKELIVDVKGENFPGWEELVRWAAGEIQGSSNAQNAGEKEAIILQLLVVGAGEPSGATPLSSAQLTEYLRVVHSPHPKSLAFLSHYVQGRSDCAGLEITLLGKTASGTHLTSADLGRYWQLAHQQGEIDLAWRIATIAVQRRILGDYTQRLWQISGEARRAYPCFPADEASFLVCISDFPPDAVHLARGLFTVGGALPFLAADALQLKVSRKKLQFRHGGFATTVAELCASFVPAEWRSYQWQTRREEAGAYPFAAAAGSNNWRTVLEHLLYLFGCGAWGWNLSTLHEAASSVVVRQRHSWKLFYRELFNGRQRIAAQWQRSLKAEERQAWHQFLGGAGKISDEAARGILFRFLCRLATAIYPHHQQAVASLQEMGAPLAYLWDFECWLLSPAYSEWRRKMGIQHEMPIPEYLHGGEDFKN